MFWKKPVEEERVHYNPYNAVVSMAGAFGAAYILNSNYPADSSTRTEPGTKFRVQFLYWSPQDIPPTMSQICQTMMLMVEIWGMVGPPHHGLTDLCLKMIWDHL